MNQPQQEDGVVANFSDQALERAGPTRLRIKRRVMLPIMLFLLTCVSTFVVGGTTWYPQHIIMGFLGSDFMPVRQALISHWQDGLIYMACVLAILLTHEMGHFLATVRYHIPASFPIFLPFPFSPIGTMGAVIGMDGLRADRRQLFDIGLAGPLAGLVVAIPVMWFGLQQIDFTAEPSGPYGLQQPLIVSIMLNGLRPDGYEPGTAIWHSQLNAYFMAGWVGCLITGLNMMPVSQLDGGHIIYTMFRKRAHWIARSFMVGAVGFMAITGIWHWVLMLGLIMVMGTDHPPTRNDNVRLGWFRTCLGIVSLSIPILFFPPHVFVYD